MWVGVRCWICVGWMGGGVGRKARMDRPTNHPTTQPTQLLLFPYYNQTKQTSYGVCVPAACNAQDIQIGLNATYFKLTQQYLDGCVGGWGC